MELRDIRQPLVEVIPLFILECGNFKATLKVFNEVSQNCHMSHTTTSMEFGTCGKRNE